MTTSLPLGVVADIGGTHARFAIATEDPCGGITLEFEKKLQTADYPSFEAAYHHYREGLAFAPTRGVFALAGPTVRDEVKLTNSPWVIRPASLSERLGLAHVRLVNDFQAIAYGIGELGPEQFRLVDGGGALALPKDGVVAVVGPGSGLGVSLLHRIDGKNHILSCEGGHIGFAPADEVDIHILRFMLTRYPRVSAERLVSGPGLAQIYIALAELEGRPIVPPHTIALWDAALSGTDQHARAAVERWLMLLGTVIGDIALAQGARAIVLAGGILPRFQSRFDMGILLSRFRSKGRFETMMDSVGVALLQHPEPGLLGAAALLGDDDGRAAEHVA